MNLTSPSQVRAFLAETGFEPSKLMGQNFLIDRNILDILCKTAELRESDHVLEVGPGLGVVTEQLLERAGRVTAVEKDKRLFTYLSDKFSGQDKLHLINADMLDVSADTLAVDGVNKLVSNLPYSVGSRILVDMMMAASTPAQMVVTVQLEVAQRLAAPPHGRQYGVLSVWAQAGYDVEIVKNISPTCFWPQPEVTSAIVNLKRHNRLPLSPVQKRIFFAVTKQVFTHRRKQLAVSLGRITDPLELDKEKAAEILDRMGIDLKARPENVSPAEWCELAKAIARL